MLQHQNRLYSMVSMVQYGIGWWNILLTSIDYAIAYAKCSSPDSENPEFSTGDRGAGASGSPIGFGDMIFAAGRSGLSHLLQCWLPWSVWVGVLLGGVVDSEAIHGSESMGSSCLWKQKEFQAIRKMSKYTHKRVCLKMGYTPNYSHLVGIMIINHWV